MLLNLENLLQLLVDTGAKLDLPLVVRCKTYLCFVQQIFAHLILGPVGGVGVHDAGVLPAGQDGHLQALGVVGPPQLLDDLLQLLMGSGAKVDLGHSASKNKIIYEVGK